MGPSENLPRVPKIAKKFLALWQWTQNVCWHEVSPSASLTSEDHGYCSGHYSESLGQK